MQQIIDPLPKNSVHRITRPATTVSRHLPTSSIAQVVGLDARNRVLLAIPGYSVVMSARLLKGISRAELMETNGVGREVLVAFDGAVPARPVIVGLLETEADEAAARIAGADKNEIKTVATRPENILIEAQGELVLKCGSGSITLRRDGKIVLRGTHLLSRASGPIRIKGGHVEIN
jgi:hypothetical protein